MNYETSTLLELLTNDIESRIVRFKNLPVSERSAIFLALSPHIQQSILKAISDSDIVDILDSMDMLQVEQILKRIPDKKRRQRIVTRLKGELKQKVEYFLRFHPDATLSHINFNYLFLPEDHTIGEVADLIDSYYDETGKYPEVLVHREGDLVGEISFASLVRERNTNPISKYLEPVQTIQYTAGVPEIIDILSSTKSKKVIVLDNDGSVIGIIYGDTVRPLFGTLPVESLYDFTGVDSEERPFDSVKEKVYHRYRWLIFNLVTCFLAGGVILGFQDTLNELTILTVYIPIIAGMAGNAAAQSFAITVRGITLGTITLHNALPALVREAGAGLINGSIIGFIVFSISIIWNNDPVIGLVVGLAIILAQTVAVIAGALIPLILKYYGKDPASSSSIFITTVTDVVGFLLLFGLATLLLL